MNANGTGEQQLTNDPAFDNNPHWSPDGKRIVFDSDRSGMSQVYTMQPNGTQIRRLTDLSLGAFVPAWSPKGTEIAFSDNACCGESDLFVMKDNGKRLRQLFETPENETGATWSPDGEKIAFEQFQLDSQGNFVVGSGEIYVVNEDGGDLTNLTNTPGADEEFPDWGPERDD